MTNFVRPIALSSLLVCMLATSSAAATCWLNDPTKSGSGFTSPIYSNDTLPGRMNHVVCGNSIVGAGCEVIINDDATGSMNADCLTIGRGVKITGNQHDFTCPANEEPCGYAVFVQEPSGSGSGTTRVENIHVAGGWTAGLVNTHYTTASEVLTSTVNLLSANVDTLVGIIGFKTVTDVVVSNVNGGEGVGLRGGANLVGSIIHDCVDGVSTSGSGNIVQNTLIADCTVSLYRPFTGPGLTLKGATLRNATNCHCGYTQYIPGSCTTLSTCADFSGTNNTFIDNEIFN